MRIRYWHLLFVSCSFLVVVARGWAGLVAYWPLDEGIGAVADSLSEDQQVTISGARWISTGLGPVPLGTLSALSFEPENGALAATEYPGLLDRGARSIAVWVRAEPDQPENAAIVSWGGDDEGKDRITLSVNVSESEGSVGAVKFETGIAFVTGSTVIADGDWHHVVVVVGEGRATTKKTSIYVDGVLDEVSGASSVDEIVDTDPGPGVTIGDSRHADGFGFLGALDEVRIYDHALSIDEVGALSSTGISLFTADPPAVESGQNATLHWEVETPFDALTLSPPGEMDVAALTVDGIGELAVTVEDVTSYTLTLTRGERVDIARARVSVALPPDVRINEVMSANERTIDDEDGDDSDWIELKNFGNAPVNLEDWFLTDSQDVLDRWRFPEVELGPGETLLVFASDKDRRMAGSELHADFKLSSSGEYLALLHPGW